MARIVLRCSAVVLGVVLGFGSFCWASTDAATAESAQARLHAKQFKNVTVKVDNGVARLGGTVDLYAYKAQAEKRVLKAEGVTAVDNKIEVGGPAVDDKALEAKLQKQIAYDRVGFGNMFNAIGVRVENGVVYLSGRARTPVDRDSARALVESTSGVKNVVDTVAVDPVSGFDDRTRFAVARAVYGYPTLNRYALNPAKPIRISVQNGHVELYGTVDSKADRDTAYLRANSVSGVFSVTNHLMVAGAPSEGL